MKKENKRKDIDFECLSCADPYSQCPYITSKSKNEKSDSKSHDNFWTKKTFGEKLLFVAECFFGIQFCLLILAFVICLMGCLLSMFGVNVQILNSYVDSHDVIKILIGMFSVDLIIVLICALICMVDMFIEDCIKQE